MGPHHLPDRKANTIGRGSRLLRAGAFALCALSGVGGVRCRAESSELKALGALRLAVTAELNASKTDILPWTYRDHDVQPGKDAVYRVIETPRGDLRRLMELDGSPLTGAARDKELGRLREYVGSPEEQAHQKKLAEADNKQAREFLEMLPTAFVWTTVSETAQTITLRFHPNRDFSPPDNQSRVLSVMAGQLVVARDGNRIQSLKGTLTDDVKFGFGFFGKIDKGGTFNVERRELSPGHWQITETHVHIGGRALLFKTIGQQDDEVKTEWHPSTAPDLPAALAQIEK